MSKFTFVNISIFTLVLAACSGGEGEGNGNGNTSGVSQSKQVGTLNANESMALCSWSIEIQGGENIETDCGEGSSTSTGTVAECVSELGNFSSCDITVGEAENCILAIAADPCEGFNDSACATLLLCLSGPAAD